MQTHLPQTLQNIEIPEIFNTLKFDYFWKEQLQALTFIMHYYINLLGL